MPGSRSHKSRVVWAIRTRQGRISTDKRRLDARGKIVSTGGASHDHEFELAVQARMMMEPGGVFVGPLWHRKRDAEPFLYEHERVVPIHLVEVPRW